jgi:hypothetical protein
MTHSHVIQFEVLLMNEEHLQKLRYETNSWNQWRRDNPEICPDLSSAVINSSATNSTLASHKSIFSIFQQKSFKGIDLRRANLRDSIIRLSDLSGADLREADLYGAEIRHCLLKDADLRGANLCKTQFISSDLSNADLEGATLGDTHFGYSPLAHVRGLDRLHHKNRSHIDQFSIIKSAPLPPTFLSNCGVQSHTIRMAELYVQSRPYHTCFISYSRRDEAFVAYLREWLTWNGVPSWFAPQDMRREEFQRTEVELERDLYTYVDEAERLFLVISPNILPSGWVGKELQRACSLIRPTPVIPILIEDMPHPHSTEWNDLINKTVQNFEYTQLNPEFYSNKLRELLSGQYVDLRGWRDPSILALHLPALLPFTSSGVSAPPFRASAPPCG